jgi:4-oxalomesaconate hydratase
MIDKNCNVLVVSAHAADFVWRAGGTIAKYIKNGANVKVIVLSFGVRGESNDLWNTSGQTVENVKRIRREESQQAANCLGVTDLEFWDYDDYYMELDDNDRINRLATVMRKFKPYHIITHGDKDVFNPDHDAVSKFAFKASVLAISNGVNLDNLPIIKQTRLFGFESHQPEICDFKPEVIIDITESYEMKIAAMQCFKAQQHLIEYYTIRAFVRGNHARRISGKNSYKYAETFTRFFPYVGDELI